MGGGIGALDDSDIDDGWSELRGSLRASPVILELVFVIEVVVIEGCGGIERGGTANEGVEVEMGGAGEDDTGSTGFTGSLRESSCTKGRGVAVAVAVVGVVVEAGAGAGAGVTVGQTHGGGLEGAAMSSMMEKKLSIATKLKSSIVSVDTKEAILSTETSIMLVNVLICV